MLYTSLFAAICATGLCMATERLLIAAIPPLFTALHALVLGSTLVVYNAHYIIKKARPNTSDRYAWTEKNRYWHFIFFIGGAAICIASLFWLSWKILLGCVVLGFLSFAYSIPLLPFENKKRIRDFGWIKITVLTSVWTIVTSVLPTLYWDKPWTAYPYEILIRFVFMFTLCVAFDIRDMQTDLNSEIFTLPNLIGLKNSYRLMDLTLMLFVILCTIQYVRYPSGTRLTGELITAIVTKVAINYTKQHSSDRVYLGLIDGMMLLYAILVLWH
ncbi:MAG: hypothetical protein BGO69_17380 [Bacteroidetes bacterium 46-16]|nr:MAG: hypothetical protein BGO69_17380 [Bacteroidetes bacterium 46-16]